MVKVISYPLVSYSYLSPAVWFIGSEPSSEDIFPPTEVYFNGSTSAAIINGTLLIDGVAFANLSEIIALADGKPEDPNDSVFFIEPGRLFHHNLQLCNLVHNCVVLEAAPSVVIRKSVLCRVICV